MVPKTGPLSNAVICNPANGFNTQQYHFLNTSFDGLVPDPTSGTGNFTCAQIDGSTILSFSRGINNGNAADAQILTYSPTNVMWAIGKGNVYNATHPNMDSVAVNLLSVPVYANSATLTSGLTLNWNVSGSRFDFQAVLMQLAWYVCVD